jgi:hypothetical protein
MAKLSIVAGATSQSCNVFIQDSSSTTGAGLSGLAYNTAGLTAYYTFAGANCTAVAITLATLAGVTSAYSSGGFLEIDATHMKGWYRFDIPNAALAASKGRSVSFHFYGATNQAPAPFEIELTGWDNQDAVRGGLTALPNAAANAAGGLPVSIAGALDLDEMNVDLEAIQTSTAGLTFTGAGKVDASVRDWVGDTIPARNVTGVPLIDVEYWDGVAIVEPATDGIPDVNVKNYNNFTAFTDVANSLPKVDVEAFRGGAMPAVSVTGVPKVDVAYINAVATTPVTTVKAVQGLTTADTITTYTGDTPQTGDCFARLGAPTGASLAADIQEIEAETDTLLSSTAQTGDTYGLLTGANTELAAVPASTATLVQMIKWLYLLARNKITQTSTTTLARNDADAATVGTSTVSDDGVTFTRGKFS